MGNKRKTKQRNNKSAPGIFHLILGDVGNRPAYAIAYNDSQNQFQNIAASGWICESCGGIHSDSDELSLDLTRNECGVLLENVRHIDDYWLRQEDAANQAIVDAAFERAQHLYQLLYTDDLDMMVQ